MSKEHFFEVYSIDVPISGGRIRAPSADWWSELEDQWEGISYAIGCYMFTLGNSRIRPWYVGKTINAFRNEVFQSHKLVHYNEAINNRRGPAKIILFPLITRSYDEDWKFSSGSSHSQLIEWLEQTLIGMAYARNPLLRNKKDATFLKSVNVRGILGEFRGRPDSAVESARRALLGNNTSS